MGSWLLAEVDRLSTFWDVFLVNVLVSGAAAGVVALVRNTLKGKSE